MSRIGPFCEDCGEHPCACPDEDDAPFTSESFAIMVPLDSDPLGCAFAFHSTDAFDRPDWPEPSSAWRLEGPGPVRDLVGGIDLTPARRQVLATLDRTTGEQTFDSEPVRPEDEPGDASKRLFDRLAGNDEDGKGAE